MGLTVKYVHVQEGVFSWRAERYVLRVNYAHARASIFTGVLNFTSDFQLT